MLGLKGEACDAGATLEKETTLHFRRHEAPRRHPQRQAIPQTQPYEQQSERPPHDLALLCRGAVGGGQRGAAGMAGSELESLSGHTVLPD